MWEYSQITDYGKIRDSTVLTIYYPIQELPRLTTQTLRKILEEADELLKRKEYIQACEKYYKVMEEVIKKLTELYKEKSRLLTNFINYVRKRGNWNTFILQRAAEELRRILNEELGGGIGDKIYEAWEAALRLHRDCFHEQILGDTVIKEKRDIITETFNLIARELEKLDIHYIKLEEDSTGFETPLNSAHT